MTTVLDQALLNGLAMAARQSPRQRTNRNFHPDDAYPAHRLLIAIEPGSYVMPHCHRDPNKDETLVIVRGALGVVIFDGKNAVERSIALRAGDEVFGIDIPHGVFHTVLALQPGTVFFEAKAGPYVPIGEDERASWAPAEGSAAAPVYLAELRALFD